MTGWSDAYRWPMPTIAETIKVCRIYDVPPWISVYGPPVPRLAWLRWRLRHVFPRLVWGRP